MGGLVVKPRSRILHGHDWVYATEVLKVFGDPVSGEVISIKDGRDQLLGVGIYNSKSQIVARRFSRRRQDLDEDFFRRRIAMAVALRERRGCQPNLCRLVWSESDGLPGVIVDRYGDVIVVQTLTLAMDQRKALIAGVLSELPGVKTVLERNDASVRSLEGLTESVGVLFGEEPQEFEITLDGVRFKLNLLHGQKTGFYLDQVHNYRSVAPYARGRRVLDCFSNQGGFALACAAAGADTVTAVESGGESILRLKANATSNGLRVNAVEQDVFDFLKSAERANAEYDLIILDPPSFTKARGRINDALRGYRDLHLRAARLLAKDGIIATFSCSHHVSSEEFEQAILSGLQDARRTMRLLARLGQAPDHPVILGLPETEYLKGLILESVPGR